MVEYKESEVIEATQKYFNGDELATSVWVNKYALRDKDGKWLEKTPRDMHVRLAKELARIEDKYPNPLSHFTIFGLLDNYKYVVLQGSPMSGIGNDHQVQSLSNCFTLAPPYDSYGGILKTDQEMVQLMKRRGGVGFDMSNIRPKDMTTNNAARTTDGIACFLERYSNSTREVAQNGRRGALMLTISIHHPEIETFINIKRDLTKVTGANMSIRITDEFMNAAKNDEDFELYWPLDGSEKKISRVVKAKEIWEKIVASARDMAEPGLIFWDTVLNNSPADSYADDGFETISCNPCSEIMLSAYDSCRLILLNLTSYVNKSYKDDAEFDYKTFAMHTQQAQRLMDDLIDLELEKIDKILDKIKNDPEPEYIKQTEIDLWKKIENSCKAGRRTGLGITGLGDTIAALGMTYGSPQSIEVTEKIYKALALNAYRSSCILAEERGAFPVWNKDKEKDNKFLNRLFEADPDLKEKMQEHGRRNIAILTTAPCGSTSTQTQTSSGIEPVFKLEYLRRRKLSDNDVDGRVDHVDELGDRWQEYEVYHHGLEKWMEATGSKEIEESPYWLATANDIEWSDRTILQGGAQKWIDHAISSTCNLRSDITNEEVGHIYFAAWEEGCKGFTVYREGCRAGVIIDKDKEQRQEESRKGNKRKKLPMDRVAITHKFSIGGHTGFLTVGFYADGKIGEIFVRMSKAGSTINGLLDSWAKATSMLLQHDVSLDEIVDNFEGVAFEPAGFTSCKNVPTARSAIDYIVKILKQRFIIGRGVNMDFELFFDKDLTPKPQNEEETMMVPYSIDSPPCRNCGVFMHKVGGCYMCPSCGETGSCG